MSALLSLKEIELIYHTKQTETIALSNLSFEAKEGEFISIVGPSGCGKTTILSLIAGTLRPTKGAIFQNGNKIKGINTKASLMFQKDNLLEWLTIYKNVMLGPSLNHTSTKQTQEKVLGLLNKYGLGDFIKSYPKELSGGMRQRVALIRTLATSPEILLLDEPFSALDYQTRILVQDNVHEIIKNENKTALLVTHDISEAVAMSDKVIVLSARPACVKKEVYLNFDKTLSPFERRKTTEFNAYFNEIWGALEQ